MACEEGEDLGTGGGAVGFHERAKIRILLDLDPGEVGARSAAAGGEPFQANIGRVVEEKDGIARLQTHGQGMSVVAVDDPRILQKKGREALKKRGATDMGTVGVPIQKIKVIQRKVRFVVQGFGEGALSAPGATDDEDFFHFGSHPSKQARIAAETKAAVPSPCLSIVSVKRGSVTYCSPREAKISGVQV